MEYCSYGDHRWQLVCGRFKGPEQRAAELLYAGVSSHIPYILVARTNGDCPDKDQASLLLVGLPESNPMIAQCVDINEIPKDGYLVQIKASPYAADRQVAVITGSSPAQVIWGVSYFLNDYLPMARRREDHIPYFQELFSNPMPEHKAIKSPAFAERGIWTWGHCIYDYQKFAQNMALMGLNSITIWNDFPPINLPDVVNCFHSYGIRVIFGYSWGWDEGVSANAPEELEHWTQRVVNDYAENYANAGGDGIYFQTFTETELQDIDGVPIADTAVHWVNTISAAMLARWPGLDIQFGLHATSVRNDLDTISKVIPSVRIVWEDCGAFPYSYLSRDVDHWEDTVEFTDKILHLRPGCGCGVVLKGQICLDWNRFEHQKGPYILGCEPSETKQALLTQRQLQWHDVQSFWLKNLDICRQMICHLRSAAVYDLVEDALLEHTCWFPVALYAQLLWTPDDPVEEILQRVAQRPCVTFA